MQYPPPLAATLPNTDATFTTRPRAFLTRGKKFMVISITPVMLTLRVHSKSSIFIHSDGPMGRERPALFTRPQSPRKLGTKMSRMFQKLISTSHLKHTFISNFFFGPFQSLLNTGRAGHVQDAGLQERSCHPLQIICALFCKTPG